LSAPTWAARSSAHAERADALTAGHRARRSRGERHAVEDFLYEYYSTRPSLLRRWHPGAGVVLESGLDGPAPHAGRRWYATDEDGAVRLDVPAFLADRGDTVRFVQRLLSATAARPAFTGCFGLHEWAMVYRQAGHRHTLPLRLGQQGTDAVVEGHPIRCTHFDAYRFFTPPARPLNLLSPSREAQAALEQPGCLHANMDLYKWAYKLSPGVPSGLTLDCFELAREVRELDMRAAPYDLRELGVEPVRIETGEGKAQYVAAQRGFSQRAQGLRARLVAACEQLLSAGPRPSPVPHTPARA
jgi:hypothetical protein